MMRPKSWKEKYTELEKAYDAVLSEKLELEYMCRRFENESNHDKEQKEEILKLHGNARKLKHDMKNHIMVITAYINDNQYEQAKDYLSKILDKLNNIYTYIETGNSLMNHILNVKLEAAVNIGMHVKADIGNLAFSMMESMDFASILTNLLDNAIEGCTGENKELHIEISKRRGYEAMLIKNSIEASVLKENPLLKSTKPKEKEQENKQEHEQTHGYGVMQIRSLTNKYEGICRFYEEDEMFCACVMIPVADNTDVF